MNNIPPSTEPLTPQEVASFDQLKREYEAQFTPTGQEMEAARNSIYQTLLRRHLITTHPQNGSGAGAIQPKEPESRDVLDGGPGQRDVA